MIDENAWADRMARAEDGATVSAGRLEGFGEWAPSSEYTVVQLAHIQACEPTRWRVDDDGLGYVWEPLR